jgi:hypothetical protein
MMGAAVPAEPGAAAPPPRQVCYHLAGDDLAIFQDQVCGGCGAVLPSTEQRELVLAVADLLTRHGDLLGPRPRPALQRLFTDRSAQSFLQANQFADVWYFSKERAELLLDWAAIALPVLGAVTRKQAAAAATALKSLAAAAGYRQQDMLDRLAEKVPNRGARTGDEHA